MQYLYVPQKKYLALFFNTNMHSQDESSFSGFPNNSFIFFSKKGPELQVVCKPSHSKTLTTILEVIKKYKYFHN